MYLYILFSINFEDAVNLDNDQNKHMHSTIHYNQLIKVCIYVQNIFFIFDFFVVNLQYLPCLVLKFEDLWNFRHIV